MAVATLVVVSALENGRRANSVGKLRDWLPVLYTLLAFREMELFVPLTATGHLETGWIALDKQLLVQWHVRSAIEYFGPIVPLFLEACYLFVYSLGGVCVGVFYLLRKRKLVANFWTVYWAGTLAAYALLPFFPSRPPRIVYPSIASPHVITWARRLNLTILNAGTIHLSVFPSAHVSSAFACAWAMFLFVPERKSLGWMFLLYALCVSAATIYGRYHYTADAIAGFAISLFAAAVALELTRVQRQRPPR